MNKEDIILTESKVVEGITYTTHHVNRPIRQGDPQGGTRGVTVGGVDKTTEVIRYVYKQNDKT